MIPIGESGRRRDGTRWRARIRAKAQSGLVPGDLYFGLSCDGVDGFVWIEDGKWARCVSQDELEPVDPSSDAG